MCGGMVETRVAMGCSFGLVLGLGHFDLLDLDTPLLLANDPVKGGYVYRGPDVPSVQGHYFYADYVCGNFWSFTYDGNNLSNFTNRRSQMSPSIEGFTVNQISSVGEDSVGNLYIVDQGSGSDGQVFKMISVSETICPDDPNDFLRQFGGPVTGFVAVVGEQDALRLVALEGFQVVGSKAFGSPDAADVPAPGAPERQRIDH